jgi:uncharacterized repeat protein (TIGR01451 family)
MMKTAITHRGIAAALLALAACHAPAFAQAPKPGCVELKTEAAVEQEYADAQGQKAKRLAPPGKVLPGDEVVWTITAKNICAKATDNVAIQNPVPEHTTYVADSAMGPGAEITFSIDGLAFKKADALMVVENGAARVARPDEYKFVRWTFKDSFAPGATAFGRYRARVN